MLPTKKFPAKSFTRGFAVKITIPLLIVILFFPLMLTSFNAYGIQTMDCFAPLTTNLDPNYAGPVVIDSFWVDQGISASNVTSSNPSKKEVGPGEGASVLAVVLNNRGSIPIDSVTGFLNLPAGFSPTGESKNPQLLSQYSQAYRVAYNPAMASYYGTVQPGSTFTLYFNLNILNNAKVTTYAASLVANYFQVGAIGQQCTSALLDVPLVLPGKVILDASSQNSEIAPQSNDPITIIIENKGSADATGVVATIVNLGNSKGSTASGSSSGSVVLQSSTTQIVNLGPNTFNLGTIPAHSTAQISTTVYPSSAAGGSTQQVELQITYENAWGKLESTIISTGLVIPPNPPQSIGLSYLGNNTTPVITAGTLDDLDFAVANNSLDNMSNIIISLVPQSTSVSIVGSSTWNIPNLAPGDRQVLATKVFAANALINTPTSFTLTANYVSKSQTQSNSLTLGTFVVGDIKLQLYTLTVNSVGNSQSISGNLLNQGSTTGLFTTVDLMPSPLLSAIREARTANLTNNQGDNQSSFQSAQAQQGQGGQGFGGQGGNRGQRNTMTQQFLGDLTPDSPIPFSIPVRGLNLLHAGMYPVAFKVVYADDLKNFHTVILNGTVNVSRSQQSGSTGSQQVSIFDQIPLPMVLGAGIAISAGIASLMKKKRSANKKLKMLTQGDTDIVSVFGSANKKEHES